MGSAWSRRLSAIAIACVCLPAADADSRVGGTPVTLARLAGPAYALALDGDRVAWRECGHVGVRDLRTGRTRRIALPPFAGASPPCHLKALADYRFGMLPRDGVALAGRLVAWTALTSGIHEYVHVHATATSDVRPPSRGLVRHDDGEGHAVSDLVADGSTILQGNVRVERDRACIEANDGDPHLECPLVPVGGGVWRIGERGSTRVPRVPPTALIAVGGGRIAVVPALADEDAPAVVEVRDARTGRLVSRAEIDGEPLALAISRSVTAVLVRRGGRHVELLDPVAGSLQRSIGVARTVPARLAVTGGTVVYSEGRRVFRAAAGGGSPRIVAVAATAPRSLSAEGRRVAWIENLRGGARIRGATLAG